MKKFIISSALSIMVLAIATTSIAQDIAKNEFTSPKSKRVVDPATRQAYRILKVNDVNVLAARHFSKKFSKAEDAMWVEGDNGTSVYFKINGLNMRSTYSKTGRNEYTLKYYDDSSMPRALRHMVKSTYYDYSIQLVTEIVRNRTTYFLVKMQNANQILTLRVVDGEISVFEKIEKSR